jgi:hypothetical protein
MKDRPCHPGGQGCQPEIASRRCPPDKMQVGAGGSPTFTLIWRFSLGAKRYNCLRRRPSQKHNAFTFETRPRYGSRGVRGDHDFRRSRPAGTRTRAKHGRGEEVRADEAESKSQAFRRSGSSPSGLFFFERGELSFEAAEWRSDHRENEQPDGKTSGAEEKAD